jgi:hypothetical protein
VTETGLVPPIFVPRSVYKQAQSTSCAYCHRVAPWTQDGWAVWALGPEKLLFPLCQLHCALDAAMYLDAQGVGHVFPKDES